MICHYCGSRAEIGDPSEFNLNVICGVPRNSARYVYYCNRCNLIIGIRPKNELKFFRHETQGDNEPEPPKAS